MPRSYVDQRVDAVVYRRIDDLLQTGHRLGALSTPPELLSVITRRTGAAAALRTAARTRPEARDLLRETVGVILRGALVPDCGAPGTSTTTGRSA